MSLLQKFPIRIVCIVKRVIPTTVVKHVKSNYVIPVWNSHGFLYVLIADKTNMDYISFTIHVNHLNPAALGMIHNKNMDEWYIPLLCCQETISCTDYNQSHHKYLSCDCGLILHYSCMKYWVPHTLQQIHCIQCGTFFKPKTKFQTL